MSVKDDIKKLLSGTVDDKLEIIEKLTTSRLKVLMGLGSNEVPKTHSYIVSDVTLKRFNRIGQEGMSSYSQEGISIAFPDSDFEEYLSEIEEYRNSKDPDRQPRRSVARWI